MQFFFFFAIGTCVSNKGWKNANGNEIWELRQIRTTKPPFIANLAHLLIFKFGTSRQVVECLTITTPDVIGFYVLQPVISKKMQNSEVNQWRQIVLVFIQHKKNYNIASDDFKYIAQVNLYLRIYKNISISEKNESPVGSEQHERE